MDLKITNDQLIELNDGCHELLDIDDLETLFSYRVSCIVEVLAPKVRAYGTTRTKLDLKYATIDIKNEDGTVTGKRAKDEEAEEYGDKVRVLFDAGVELKVPSVRLSEIHRMREEEGVPIDASTIRKIHPVTVLDMDLALDEEPAAAQLDDEDETKKPARIPRAERVKQTAADRATPPN